MYGGTAKFQDDPHWRDLILFHDLVHVDANMVHGWPLLSAALTAMGSCGASYATTLSERPAASSIYALSVT